jgi:hypothetical protein
LEWDDRGWEKWEVPKGEIGELVVRGTHVCQEYYKNPVAFKRNKIREVGGQVWHRTGDVCFLDPNGRLWIAGRVHNAIFRENTYLFPVHAEILLKSLEFVNQAAYAGKEDEKLGEKACVAISLREGFGVEKSEYQDRILALFRTHKLPVDEIRIVGELYGPQAPQSGLCQIKRNNPRIMENNPQESSLVKDGLIYQGAVSSKTISCRLSLLQRKRRYCVCFRWRKACLDRKRGIGCGDDPIGLPPSANIRRGQGL